MADRYLQRYGILGVFECPEVPSGALLPIGKTTVGDISNSNSRLSRVTSLLQTISIGNYQLENSTDMSSSDSRGRIREGSTRHGHSRLDVNSHRVSPLSGVSSSGDPSNSLENTFEDRLEEHQIELEGLHNLVANLKGKLSSRDARIVTLQNELKGKELSIREAKQQLKALEIRHAESCILSQKTIAEVRLSRDEEVVRLELELEALKKEHQEREKVLECECKDATASLQNSIDSIKTANSQLRQENEVLQSNMKKADARARDAERETQRAVNRFEAAVKSLEQLEHQYAVLEDDSKETEHVKTQRILSLEQEVEDLRMSKSQALHDAQREILKLTQKVEECLESLEHAEKSHRKAELSAAESLHREKALQNRLENLQTTYDKMVSDYHDLQEETSKTRGEVERLRGSLEGTSSASQSMQEILKTYERDNAALMHELNGLRTHLKQVEGDNRDKVSDIDVLKKEISKLHETARIEAKAAASETSSLQKELDALRGEAQTRERLWKAEKTSLTRELEIMHAKIEVLSQRSIVKQSVSLEDPKGAEKSGALHSEVTRNDMLDDTQREIDDDSSSDAAQSISFGDQTDGMENTGKSSDLDIEHFKTPKPSQNQQELRDQLTALKLSILDSTSKHSTTKQRLESTDQGYILSYRQDAPEDDVLSESETSSVEDDDADALSKARHQVSRAKQYLSRLSTVENH